VFIFELICCWIEAGQKHLPILLYEGRYLQFLLSNHPELLNSAIEEVDSIAENLAEEVNGDLSLQMYKLKLELNEMKGKFGEVMQEIQETMKEMKQTKKEMKKEIMEEMKAAAPVLTCHIS
jgi:methyl-accepting chemotaxis protein